LEDVKECVRGCDLTFLYLVIKNLIDLTDSITMHCNYHELSQVSFL